MYHTVAILDDDPTSTFSDLAAADFIDGESEVRRHPVDSDKTEMLLVGIRAAVAQLPATLSLAVNEGLHDGRTRLELQPSNWADSERLYKVADFLGLAGQDTTATDLSNPPLTHPPVFTPESAEVGKRRVTVGTDWVNPGRSRWRTLSATATNFLALLYYQIPDAKVYSYSGGPVIYVEKAAGVDITADQWSRVVKEELDDDGLDPDATYRVLAGQVRPEGALDSIAMGWRVSVGGAEWLAGIGGSFWNGGGPLTVFLADSIIGLGSDEWTIEAVGDAASKPTVGLWLEQITAGRSKNSWPPPGMAKGAGRGIPRLGALPGLSRGGAGAQRLADAMS